MRKGCCPKQHWPENIQTEVTAAKFELIRYDLRTDKGDQQGHGLVIEAQKDVRDREHLT
jgi:hypothetical protein